MSIFAFLGTNSNNDSEYRNMNTHNQHVTPLLAPPPKITKRSTLNLIEDVKENGVYNNIYNSSGANKQTIDIFGMQNFFTNDVDKKILEIQVSILSMYKMHKIHLELVLLMNTNFPEWIQSWIKFR